MINLDKISSRELATCVDEFVRRAIDVVRKAECDQMVSVSIVAGQYNTQGEYTINQKVLIGSEYGSNYQSTTDNLVNSAQRAVQHWLEDQNDKPTTVRPMLAAPEPVDLVPEGTYRGTVQDDMSISLDESDENVTD